MKLIGLNGVRQLLGCSKEEAVYILNQKGCPTLPREKGQRYRIFDEDLIGWLNRSNKELWK